MPMMRMACQSTLPQEVLHGAASTGGTAVTCGSWQGFCHPKKVLDS